MKDRKRPVVKCFGRKDTDVFMFQFWCPFCQRWHLHGYGKGHRVAHCHDSSSPFYKTGYIIKPYTKSELLEIRTLIDLALKQGAYGRTYDKKLRCVREDVG